MNILPVLSQLNFRTFSLNGVVTDVALYVGDDTSVATEFVNRLLDVRIPFSDEVTARVFCKYLVQIGYESGYIFDDIGSIIEECNRRTSKFVGDESWSFLWSKPDIENVKVAIKSVVVAGMSAVATKVDAAGKVTIKKGGKNVLCGEMFLKHIVEPMKSGGIPMSYKDFHQLIVDELGLTKLGANTYMYNEKTKHGLINARKQ